MDNSDTLYPLISVLYVNYNQKRFLEKSLESLKLQTYPRLQFLLGDDASTDGSQKVIRDWVAQSGLNAEMIFNGKNSGICNILNRLMEKAKGEYIAILAADDVWYPGHILSMYEAIKDMPPEYGVLYKNGYLIDEVGNRFPGTFIADHRSLDNLPEGDVFLDLAKANWISIIASLTKKECFDYAGSMDERLVYEDWDIWLRISMKYRFAYCPEITSATRIVNSSLTRQHLHARSVEAEISDFLISLKLLKTNRLTDELKRKHALLLSRIGKKLYRVRYKHRRKYLFIALYYHFSFRLLAMLLLSLMGSSFMLRERTRT